MFTKIKDAIINPVNDAPTYDTLEALHALIQLRDLQISTSPDYINRTRCYIDPNQPDLIFVHPKTEPLPGTTFQHPKLYKPCATLVNSNQAGRVAITFQPFETTCSVFTATTKHDNERNKYFTKLNETSWVNIPCTLILPDNSLLMPLNYGPAPTDVVLVNNFKHYKILSVKKEENFNVCSVQEVN